MELKEDFTNGFLRGLSQVLKIRPRRYQYEIEDTEAMAKDWQTVGNDMRAAIYEFKEGQSKIKSNRH